VPNYYDLASYRGALGKRAFVEAQFALRRWERRETASVSAAIADSPMLARSVLVDGAPAHYNAPYFDVADPEKRNSVQGAGNVTYLLGGAAGRHEIKGGYEFFRSQRTGGSSQSPTGYVFDTDYLVEPGSTSPVLDANGRFIPLWVPGETLIENWLPTRGATLNVDTQSIYVQDRWAIGDRWSADIGVRQERVSTTATDAFDGIDTKTWLPRLAVGYGAGARSSHIVHATYGHYAGRYDEAQIARSTSIANPDLWVGVYVGSVGQGRSFTAGLNPANYLTLAGRFPTANVTVDSQLLSPLVRELTTSYAVQPANGRGFVQAAYIWRDWRRFIEDFVSIANGTTQVVRKGFDVGTFTNVAYRNADAASRTYSAIELFGRYDLRRRWTLNGNYTLQLRNAGNNPGENAGAPATSALGNYPEIFSAERHYPDGRLPSFQRSTLRLWSIGHVDFGRVGALAMSGLVRVSSGRAYSLVAANQPLTAIQNARLQAAGYPDRPPSQTIFFADRGTQTFKGYGVVDLGVTYDIPLFKGLKPWAKLEIYNALDNQSLVAWDTTVTQDPASSTDALGLRTGYRAAPTFGKATSNEHFPIPFQGATGGRTFRVALGVRF
jgi:outer membrane receptor protein involved in Fe transport